MSVRDRLSAVWPFYGLTLTTPRLELKLPTDTDLIDLGSILRGGIQRPGGAPFQAPWMYEPAPHAERGLLQSFFNTIAHWDANDWDLGFAVFFEGRPIGIQHITSKSFAATGCFGSGCWLGLPYQGHGLGTEMGQAILTLGFEWLEAREAYIGAWADNAASLRVIDKLGYISNGQYYQPFGDTVRLDKRLRLPRERWLHTQRPPVRITGLEPCLPLLGLPDSHVPMRPS